MINSNTVFIVGAGASAEFNFPVGKNLKTDLAKKLNLKFDGYNLSSGDADIATVLRDVAPLDGNSQFAFNDLMGAARQVSDTMPLAVSIDNYLNDHKNNGAAIIASKLAIVKTISEYEKASPLYVDHRKNDELDFASIKENWLLPFWQIVQDGIDSHNVASIFNNITIVSFNYDRCIEQFLTYALSKYYRLSTQSAAEMVNKIDIVHPYGSVGQFGVDLNGPSVRLGKPLVNRELYHASQHIKTFSESIDDGIRQQIGTYLYDARRVVFLGFGFHDQNLALLSNPRSNLSDLVATIFGLSDQEFSFIRQKLKDIFPNVENPHFEQIDCCRMIERIGRRLKS